MFDLGRLVIDTNGDSVPDLVNASLVIGVTPSVTAISAATEISARLGFETMGLDLPIQRGVNGEILIVIGRDGLAASNVESPGVDPTSLCFLTGLNVIDTSIQYFLNNIAYVLGMIV